MVNAGKKLFNIALEYPAGFGIVLAGFLAKSPKPSNGFMGSFVIAARKRIADKCFIKKLVKQVVNSVMQKPISNFGFVNCSWLWVVYGKSLISAVFVC